MNLKTTIALLILAAGVGVLVWKGSSLAPRAGLAPPPLPEAKGKSAEALADIKRDDVTSVDVNDPRDRARLLRRPPLRASRWKCRATGRSGGTRSRSWSASSPGSSPASSRSRSDPTDEGSADVPEDPMVWSPAAGPRRLVRRRPSPRAGRQQLAFGEAPPSRAKTRSPGRRSSASMTSRRCSASGRTCSRSSSGRPSSTASGNCSRTPPASRSPTPRRTAPVHRPVPPPERRHPDPRGRAAGQVRPQAHRPRARSRSTPPDKPAAEAVVVATRLADAWEIVEPVHDRADPVKLRGVLAAIPDLWVEQFLVNPDQVAALAAVLPGRRRRDVAVRRGPRRPGRGAVRLDPGGGRFLERAGLKDGADEDHADASGRLDAGAGGRQDDAGEHPGRGPDPAHVPRRPAAAAQDHRGEVLLRQARRQPARLRDQGGQAGRRVAGRQAGPARPEGPARQARPADARPGRGPAPRPEPDPVRVRPGRRRHHPAARPDAGADADQAEPEGRVGSGPQGAVGPRRPVRRAGRAEAGHRPARRPRKADREEERDRGLARR